MRVKSDLPSGKKCGKKTKETGWIAVQNTYIQEGGDIKVICEIYIFFYIFCFRSELSNEMPITAVAHNAGIVGSNPTQGMDVCIVCSSPVQGVLPTLYRIKKLKRCQDPMKGWRAIIIKCNDMGGACNTRRKVKNIFKIFSKKLTDRDLLREGGT
jgi:hypothetical protein